MVLYPINFAIRSTDSLETLYSYIEQIEELIFNKLKDNTPNEDNNKIDDPLSFLPITNKIMNIEQIFDEEFLLDMEEEIYYQIDEYEIKDIFHIDENLINKITEVVTNNILLSIDLIYCDDNDDENDNSEEIELLNENEITEFVKERVNTYFKYVFPNIHTSPPIPKSIKVSEFDSYQPVKTVNEIALIQQQIELLKSQYQPEQRTPEWYEFRNGIMTASNIYKILGTQAQYNSFICEKCTPIIISQNNYINTTDTRHWGQKYEKLSIKIYENMYNTRVSEFGCIKHSEYEFIGASPDGIVTSPNGANHYGRMIEIKNIVNREITGIPLEAYWVQMQIQMEVCNLDICNFIETRFKECETIDEWKAVNKPKGVIISNIPILFIEYVTPEYEFIILKDDENIETFIQKWNLKKVEIKWWYMDEFSCVVVPRNKDWFKSVLPRLIEAWNTILREKETGEYKKRLPKKKQTKTKCLIQLENTEDKKEDFKEIVNNYSFFESDEQKEFLNKNDETIKLFYIGNEKTGLNKNTIVVKDI